MRRFMMILGLVATAAALGYAAAVLRGARPGLSADPRPIRSETAGASHSPEAPRTNQGTRVYALARLEPAGGLIVVGARPGARIERVLVSAGDLVKAGQPLAIVEGQEEARRRLALAEAEKAAALQRRARTRDRIAIERAREDRLQPIRLAMLVSTTSALKAEDDRLSKDIDLLGKDPKAAAQYEQLLPKLDEVRIASYKAVFELEQARADEALLDRKRAAEDQALADGGPDDQVLDRQIDLARVALDATTVKAPIAGQVIEVNARGGEVGSGPLLTLGDLGAMDAEAEVEPSDADRINEGDAATVTILGAAVPGKVTRVGRLVGRNRLLNVDPRALQDQRVLNVTIRLNSADPASRFINMQVEAAITPGKLPAR